MNFNLRNPVWIAAIVVLAIAVVFAGSALFAGANAPATAATGCGMQQASSGCSMMGSGGSQSCPMPKAGGMKGMTSGCKDCAMLAGKVASVGRDGFITVRIKPVANTTAAAKKAIGHLKAGDSVSVMMMLGKAQSGASASTAQKAAKYTCPMHPDVTSGKPGQCPKCGMNLTPMKPQNK